MFCVLCVHVSVCFISFTAAGANIINVSINKAILRMIVIIIHDLGVRQNFDCLCV